MGYIYILEDTRNNKKYVGKHIGDKNTYWSGGVIPNRIAKKYGREVFTRTIIEDDIPNELLNNREIFYIRQFNTVEDGYNLTYGGDGGDTISNHPNKEEIVKKIAKALKNRVFTEEHLIKLKENHMSKDYKNRQKISEGLKGIPKTDEHKLKLSESASKYNKSIKKWVGDNNPLNDKDIRDRISILNKERAIARRMENINKFIEDFNNGLIDNNNIKKYKYKLWCWYRDLGEEELNSIIPKTISNAFTELCEKIKRENIKHRTNKYKGFKHSDKTKEIMKEKSKLINEKKLDAYLKFCNDLYDLMESRKVSFLVELSDDIEYGKIRKKIISSPFLYFLEEGVKGTLLKVKTKEKIIKPFVNPNKNHHNKKKTISINGVIYNSINSASIELNMDRGTIRYRLNSNRYPTYIYM